MKVWLPAPDNTRWKRLGICNGFPWTDSSDVLPNGTVQVGTEHLHQICFICGSECVTPQKHRRLSWDNTCRSYTSITQRLWLHGRKLQWPQMINGTAGKPIWCMALGDLIDVAVISWEFKSMFSLLCVAGKGRPERLSVSDPETNSCRECVDFLWTLICQHSLRRCSEILA